MNEVAHVTQAASSLKHYLHVIVSNWIDPIEKHKIGTVLHVDTYYSHIGCRVMVHKKNLQLTVLPLELLL